MIRRHLIVMLTASLALTAVESSWPGIAIAKDGDSGGNSGSGGGGDSDGGRGGGDNSGKGSDNSGRGGGDDGGGRGRDDDAAAKTGWGTTSSESAREAVSQGWALALSTVLPTVSKAVPGKVLEVDLRQSWTGEWRYEFLILTRDRRYQEVVVDARRNQILQIRRR